MVKVLSLIEKMEELFSCYFTLDRSSIEHQPVYGLPPHKKGLSETKISALVLNDEDNHRNEFER